MPHAKDIANGIAKYFQQDSEPSAPVSASGNGDAETAQAHKEVNDQLGGEICPDCHSIVKGAMVKVFGQPASDSEAAPAAPTAAPTTRAIPDISKINYPKG